MCGNPFNRNWKNKPKAISHSIWSKQWFSYLKILSTQQKLQWLPPPSYHFPVLLSIPKLTLDIYAHGQLHCLHIQPHMHMHAHNTLSDIYSDVHSGTMAHTHAHPHKILCLFPFFWNIWMRNEWVKGRKGNLFPLFLLVWAIFSGSRATFP